MDNKFGIIYNCPPMRMQDNRIVSTSNNERQFNRSLHKKLAEYNPSLRSSHEYRKLLQEDGDKILHFDPKSYYCDEKCTNDFYLQPYAIFPFKNIQK